MLSIIVMTGSANYSSTKAYKSIKDFTFWSYSLLSMNTEDTIELKTKQALEYLNILKWKTFEIVTK